jgi:hypothetical protein
VTRLLLFGGVAGLVLASPSPPAAGAVEASDHCVPVGACLVPDEALDLVGRLPLLAPDLGEGLAGADVAPLAEAGAVAPPALAVAPLPRPYSPVRIVVSLPQQKLYVFKAGEFVTSSAVSTGRKGYATPVGRFPILQKKVHHRSTTYDNAPMPYMQRLTWSGVALHAGHVTGRPASHGCIRLPHGFAKKLYGMTNFGTTVTVTRERPSSPEEALELS